ncbi:ferritin heavy chain [Zootermopsis nevadensis]|uniref:Ferritin n=1 Tax=Zootermopsis nevadensis TaxID=136037 RepID=A0A067RBS6_ZOONE|nr:ferritin heavy chain [Zootermopsis nevadensis]XP_021926068.1 ferritin heavy chain [Zootermopsis nevadensis]KDR16114.1 Ferritin heavy chain [Zootermopsis nevadensis]
MKFLVVLFGLLAVSSAEFCYNDVVRSCKQKAAVLLEDCHAKYGAIDAVLLNLQSYVNDHISLSFDYLLTSTHFGNHEKSREGFEKLFRKLSDSTWNDAIDLIQYITKRGGVMDFQARKTKAEPRNVYELYEIEALARGLDTQKTLAKSALAIHSEATRRCEGCHDPEVSSYLEEKFMHRQAEEVRKLAGYTSDLKRLLSENNQASLSLFLFDEYLQKAV